MLFPKVVEAKVAEILYASVAMHFETYPALRLRDCEGRAVTPLRTESLRAERSEGALPERSRSAGELW